MLLDTRQLILKAKIGIFAAWVLLLVLVNRQLVDGSWGELIFTGVSAGLMTHAQHLVDQRKSRLKD
ncbi:hypothetical protein [Streptomyces sp. NPDC048606]|uniref:hypothetical protein n=1 Tax=Streptomyces sp. NPDC048606 TaxID=3154726 RepID=UPI00341ACE20